MNSPQDLHPLLLYDNLRILVFFFVFRVNFNFFRETWLCQMHFLVVIQSKNNAERRQNISL